ncbi:hypothetical protein OBBRIDRAFT_796383 [Obba rivulosa]|uniref:BTB domain-containing protein n=1 Tax=Obba rivulosa TaxID=1052685 RepID=A0A8E2AMI4_9APHY|nr:hypothetical protein OBBRIDRAFT_796383 [Obba rivulosa]
MEVIAGGSSMRADVLSDTTNQPATSVNRPRLKRSIEFWDPSGTVMLISGSVAFRIHQEPLGCHSLIFRKLFSIPRWQDVADQLDDCPIIRLPDNPFELNLLLRAVLNTDRSVIGNTGSHARPKFSDVAAVVRLGYKYEMDDIWNDALDKVTPFFTATFPNWDSLEHYMARAPFEIGLRDAIVAVSLAHLTGAITMLPLAFYMCCQLEGDLLKGFARNGRRERLCLDDQIKCASGKELLERGAALVLFRVFRVYQGKVRPQVSCCKRAHLEAFRRCLSRFKDGIKDEVKNALDSQLDRIDNIQKFCPNCLAALRERELEARREVWEELPLYFGVGTQCWPTDAGDI